MTNVLERHQTRRAARTHQIGWHLSGRGREVAVVVALAVVAAAAWLPFLHAPLTSDEGGYLLIAHQWRQGTSLYGGYWVDRPPLLLWLFGLAGHLGPASAAGPTAAGVKLLGAAASGVSVLLTGVLAHLVAPRSPRRRIAAVVLAAALLSSPLLGMSETDGEVLAVPFVLAGLCCVVAAMRARRTGPALLSAAGSGAAAMAAALVKQNMVDVFVLAAVLGAVLAWGSTAPSGRPERVADGGAESGRRHLPSRALVSRAAAFCAGAVAMLTTVVVGAAARGTSPGGLWEAVVTFRLQASAVIGSSATSATTIRLLLIVAAFVASGAAAVLVTYVVPLVARRRSEVEPLLWPALAMVAWELVGVAAGGSYWLHYLTGLVPGLVLLVLVVRPGPRQRRVVAACLAYAVVANLVVWTYQAIAPVSVNDGDAAVVTYLRAHAGRTDGVVVAYGHPDIVAGSGLTSPYEELWSLPVRVRDPHLRELTRVLEGRHAPRWIITPSTGLTSWGLQAAAAQSYLRTHYADRATPGGWHVWERVR